MPRLTAEKSNDIRSAQDAPKPTMLSHTTSYVDVGFGRRHSSLMHNYITVGYGDAW